MGAGRAHFLISRARPSCVINRGAPAKKTGDEFIITLNAFSMLRAMSMLWERYFRFSLIYYAIMTLWMKALEADRQLRSHFLFSFQLNRRLFWFSVIFSFPWLFRRRTEMLWTHSTKFDGIWTSRRKRSQPTASGRFWIGPRTRRASLASKSRICMRGSTGDWRYRAWAQSQPKSAREKCLPTTSHTASKVSVDIYIHLCLSMI